MQTCNLSHGHVASVLCSGFLKKTLKQFVWLVFFMRTLNRSMLAVFVIIHSKKRKYLSSPFHDSAYFACRTLYHQSSTHIHPRGSGGALGKCWNTLVSVSDSGDFSWRLNVMNLGWVCRNSFRQQTQYNAHPSHGNCTFKQATRTKWLQIACHAIFIRCNLRSWI